MNSLLHTTCGQAFVPVLSCAACHEKVGIGDLGFALEPVEALREREPARARAPRLAPAGEGEGPGLGLRVERWSLPIDRLGGAAGLLLCQTDLADGRRKIYRLTPASRDLLGYILCFSSWASRQHFRLPSAIRSTDRACGQPCVPQVVCSRCHEALLAHQVRFEPNASAQSA